ncbi:conserved hypothetical protein [Bacillus sp. 349Y]|nr:conserved hypothetical protein [Bacillus sp. 349Y]
MNLESKLEIFKYFLECYFNESENYEGLEELVNVFNEEDIDYRIRLYKELTFILNADHIDYVQELIKIYGKRKMSKDKVYWLIAVIQENVKTY